jgi:GT2 family glycosyltransferase
MKMDKPRVSVIVLNWNGKRFLEKCLGSLLNQDYSDYEVLLVDNGSTDGSVEFVKEKFGKNTNLKVIALKKNYGFSKGNNIGIKYAQGDYVIILNNDTKVKENFITEFVKTAESDYQIGSVGCKILFKKGNVWFSQKFMNVGFIVPFFLQTLVEERIETISKSFAINLSNSGCAVLYRKSVLDEVGLFDEDFWSNWEDWDLGYRINLAGYKSVYIPMPLVYHVGGGSEGFSPERYVRIYRNTLFMYFKNYEMRNLLTRFPLFLFIMLPLYHIGWFLHRLITHPSEFYREQGLQYFFSIGKAVFEFLLKLRPFMEKRYFIQQLRKVSDREIFSSTRLKGII